MLTELPTWNNHLYTQGQRLKRPEMFPGVWVWKEKLPARRGGGRLSVFNFIYLYSVFSGLPSPFTVPEIS